MCMPACRTHQGELQSLCGQRMYVLVDTAGGKLSRRAGRGRGGEGRRVERRGVWTWSEIQQSQTGLNTAVR